MPAITREELAKELNQSILAKISDEEKEEIINYYINLNIRLNISLLENSNE
jgi:hypothetical protein